MNFETIAQSKLCATNIALMFPGVFMDSSHMSLKMSFLATTFQAHFTLMFFLVLVDTFNMSFEMVASSKSLVANIALKFFDVFMNIF